MVIKIKSLSELQTLAKNIAKSLHGDEIVALIGELGAGKTTFTKALLKASGIKSKITSPTFVLMIPYKKAAQKFVHMDLYRLKNFADVKALGVEDSWGKKNNIYIIEWADKIKRQLPKKTIIFSFKIKGLTREITLKNVPKYFKI